MNVKQWKAEISMLVNEGTDTARQTFAIEGGTCTPQELPEKVSVQISKVLAILSDKTPEQKQIANLEKQLADIRKKHKLVQEANAAAHEKASKLSSLADATEKLAAVEESEEMPVVKTRRRRS